ncbi:uncharacterized protein LOC112083993 [Eutrema salsugineum]|uniref:uncharacterized protein LOC112083993 n=1 Tax=Eutrema salsugineum TaxID=72664 RepID=UPI000CED286A|nr:uncharacterized protein LOC112083993 [Eutrema salsugineum]
MNKTCQGWNFTSNHLSDADGRIILIWKSPASLRVMHQSSQSLTCEVLLPNATQYVFTAVYASNQGSDRTDLWVELLNLQQTYSLHTCPWVVGGDFNQIVDHSEHSLPSVNANDSSMHQFRDCLNQMGLFDLRSQGPTFTWSNRQPLNPIAKKLDRLLVNNHWINLFPDSIATFYPPLISDHSPCLLDLFHLLPKAGTRPFKFFNYLTKHPKFHQTVVEAWIQAGSIANNLSALCYKQRIIKRNLKLLNRENFSQIQVQSLQAPSAISFQHERDISTRLNFLKGIEESYFRQKSRINWLRDGDQNTSYFHNILKVRTNANSIKSFLLDNDVLPPIHKK